MIAEKDLALRGPGELLGSRQSGDAMLRFVDLQNEHDLIEKTKELSSQLMLHFPEVSKKHLERWLGHRADFLKA